MPESGEGGAFGRAAGENNSGRGIAPPPPPSIRTHLTHINNMVINIFKAMPLSAKLIKNKAIEVSNMEKLVNYTEGHSQHGILHHRRRAQNGVPPRFNNF
jgi:hypothetical protein